MFGSVVGKGFIPPVEVDGSANNPGGYGIRPYAVGVGVPDDPWGLTAARTATGRIYASPTL